MPPEPSHWVHDLDPILIHLPIPGIGGIRWYGLAYFLGLVVGWWLLRRSAQRQLIPLAPPQIADVATYIGVGMLVGGRLGYCIGYHPEMLLRFDGSFPFWDVLKLWEGGMASHGGLAGFFAACYFLARRFGVKYLIITDCVAAVAPIGVALGRLANFINGELWGKVGEVRWAMHFPDSVVEFEQGPVSQLDFVQRWQAYVQAERPLQDGMPMLASDYFPTAMHQLAFVRQGLEPGSPAWDSLFRLMTDPRHPSPLYAMMLEGILVFAITWPLFQWNRCRRPGLATASAMGLYGVGRFIGEFWRQPDLGQPVFLGWMSKGQLYTIPVLIAAVAFIILSLRRPAADPGAPAGHTPS